MEILCHRGLWVKTKKQNTLNAFKMAFEAGFGVELDVRDFKSKIIISHDPSLSTHPILLSDFFDLFKTYKQKNKMVAVNIKTDGIAEEISRLVNQYDISNYFTFDMSIPEMLHYKNYKYLVINEDFDTALSDLEIIICWPDKVFERSKLSITEQSIKYKKLLKKLI